MVSTYSVDPVEPLHNLCEKSPIQRLGMGDDIVVRFVRRSAHHEPRNDGLSYRMGMAGDLVSCIHGVR